MPENIIQIADNIQKLIAEIGKCRREIEGKGQIRATAIKVYDMKLAIALATLREADNYEMAGRKWEAPPVSIMEKIAKGMVAQERYDLEVAESGYKAAAVNLEALQCQLMAFQPLYKHLESA